MNVDDQLVPRTNLLGEFRISDSSERRRRREGGDWPPHVLVGKKIYYTRSAIETWLRRQEAKSQRLQSLSTEPAEVAGNE